jgi:hypothetical protein
VGGIHVQWGGGGPTPPLIHQEFLEFYKKIIRGTKIILKKFHSSIQIEEKHHKNHLTSKGSVLPLLYMYEGRASTQNHEEDAYVIFDCHSDGKA